MYLKVIPFASMLLNILLVNAMNDETSFWSAVTSKKYEDVKSFLQRNSSLVHSCMMEMYTPIFFAVESKDVTLLNILLSYKSDIYIRRKPTYISAPITPIYEAVCYDAPEIVKILIAHHKANGEPEDKSEFGFYGKYTLEMVKAANPTIIGAFKELKERK